MVGKWNILTARVLNNDNIFYLYNSGAFMEFYLIIIWLSIMVPAMLGIFGYILYKAYNTTGSGGVLAAMLEIFQGLLLGIGGILLYVIASTVLIAALFSLYEYIIKPLFKKLSRRGL